MIRVNQFANFLDTTGEEIAFVAEKALARAMRGREAKMVSEWSAAVQLVMYSNRQLNVVFQEGKGTHGYYVDAMVNELNKPAVFVTTPKVLTLDAIANYPVSSPELARNKHEVEMIVRGDHSFDMLSDDAARWLADVNDGPGRAPIYGGLKIPFFATFAGSFIGDKDENFHARLTSEEGCILICVSTAADPINKQGLVFATEVLKQLRKYFDQNPSLFLEMNLAPLREERLVKLTMERCGITK